LACYFPTPRSPNLYSHQGFFHLLLNCLALEGFGTFQPDLAPHCLTLSQVLLRAITSSFSKEQRLNV
jgi:membrane associated rhomboid family serine protease